MSRHSVIGAALVGIALLLPASAAGGSRGIDRPFHSSSSGLTSVKLQTGELWNDSGGNATHLGLFTRHDVAQIVPHPGAPSGYVGTSVLTAANGDEIVMRCVGTSTTADNGVHSTSVVTCTLTSGTGRFAAVSGSIVSTSHSTLAGVDPVTMTATYESESAAEGQISY